MNLFRATVIFFLFSQASAIYAGGEVGNGGYGVLIGGELQLLDFAENKIIDPNISLQHDGDLEPNLAGSLRKILMRVIVESQSEVAAIVSRKVAHFIDVVELAGISFPVGELVKHASTLNWTRVQSRCLDVYDESDAQYPHRIQLAFRIGQWVRFCEESHLLSDEQFAGLIIHEILYSSVRNRGPVKDLNAYLFSSKIDLDPELQTDELSRLLTKYQEDMNLALKIKTNPAKYLPVKIGNFTYLNKTIRISQIKTNAIGLISEVKVVLDWQKGGVGILYSFVCDSDLICRIRTDDRSKDGLYFEIRAGGELVFYSKQGSARYRAD